MLSTGLDVAYEIAVPRVMPRRYKTWCPRLKTSGIICVENLLTGTLLAVHTHTHTHHQTHIRSCINGQFQGLPELASGLQWNQWSGILQAECLFKPDLGQRTWRRIRRWWWWWWRWWWWISSQQSSSSSPFIVSRHMQLNNMNWWGIKSKNIKEIKKLKKIRNSNRWEKYKSITVLI